MATAKAKTPSTMIFRTATFRLVSQPGSALMYSKKGWTEKDDNETNDQHERRTWNDKIHYNANGQLFISRFAIKNCLEAAGRWLSMKIPGEGSKKFTQRFAAGIMCTEDVMLSDHDGNPIRLDEKIVHGTANPADVLREGKATAWGAEVGNGVYVQSIFAPSKGDRGGPKRVPKLFPTVPEWQGEATIMVYDEKIDEKVLMKHLEAAGMFVGLGSMRVGNGGINGRFDPSDLLMEKTNLWKPTVAEIK